MASPLLLVTPASKPPQHICTAVGYKVLQKAIRCSFASVMPFCHSGGQLASYLRMRYPDVIAGAIASSPTSFGCPGLGLVCLVIACSIDLSIIPLNFSVTHTMNSMLLLRVQVSQVLLMHTCCVSQLMCMLSCADCMLDMQHHAMHSAIVCDLQSNVHSNNTFFSVLAT